MTVLAVMCMLTILEASGNNLSENSTLQDKEYTSLINAAQWKFCSKSAKCHSTTNILSEDIKKLETLIEYQKYGDRTSFCEPCKCSDKCCCDSDADDQEEIEQTIECIYPQVKQLTPYDNSFPRNKYSFEMINSCPTSRQNSTIISDDTLTKERCANGIFDNGHLMVPVVDVKTKLSYRNKYCAKCNAKENFTEEDLVHWESNIECSKNFIPVSLSTVVNDTLENDMCNIIFYPKNNFDAVKCIILIDKCNISGIWAVYNHHIRNLCGFYTAAYQIYYKNFFCYLCNSGDTDPNAGGNLPVSLRMLLHHNLEVFEITDDDEHHSNDRCVWNTAFDSIQERCVQATCFFPKIFMKGKCINGAQRIGGVWYRAFLVLMPLHKVKFVKYTAKSIFYFIQYWLNEIQLQDLLTKLSVHFLKENTSNETETLIEYLVVHIEFQVADFDDSLIDTSLIDKLLLIKDFDCRRCDYAIRSVANNFHFYYDHFDLTHSNYGDDIKLYLLQEDAVRNLTRVIEVIIESDLSFNSDNPSFTLYPTFICPMIALNKRFYNISRYNWGIYIERINAFLNKTEYFIKEEGGICKNENCIFVCLDTFKKIEVKYESISGACAWFYMLNKAILMIFSVAVGLFSIS